MSNRRAIGMGHGLCQYEANYIWHRSGIRHATMWIRIYVMSSAKKRRWRKLSRLINRETSFGHLTLVAGRTVSMGWLIVAWVLVANQLKLNKFYFRLSSAGIMATSFRVCVCACRVRRLKFQSRYTSCVWLYEMWKGDLPIILIIIIFIVRSPPESPDTRVAHVQLRGDR